MITALPTLGGSNAITTISNSRGQIAGLAENGVHDSTCSFPAQVLRFEAAVWGGRGKAGDFPLAGDTVGYAQGESNGGEAQVVGASGNCANAGPLPWDCLSDTMLCCGRTGRPETWATSEARPRAKPARLTTAAK